MRQYLDRTLPQGSVGPSPVHQCLFAEASRAVLVSALLVLWFTMTSPSQAENQPASGHKRVLANFIERLISAISQSPLLRIRPSKRGRLLDCSQMERVGTRLSRDLLQAV